ncbi:solute carrier family 35 member F4-like [Corticium candelabrum]|uniref:solute carrier family 35 member F4-like n=1 Tax=Corticium candelabrum TaxID=121492 RepID=UPI002E26A306|nr:solute carrier family 35 member F4-like [Corticium candelabrum]
MDEEKTDKFDRKKFIWGVVIVLCIALSWVGATQATKSTYKDHFDGTFFIVWFSTCWMVVCFPVYLLKETLVTKTPVKEVLSNSLALLKTESRPSFTLPTLINLICVVSPFCLLWIATNYMYAKALGLHGFAPADVTALFSSAPAFVYILSFFLLNEKFTASKVLAVALAITGVVLFQYANGFSAVTLVGSLLSVGAAIGAALYKTSFKRYIGDASLAEVALFLTTLGLLNLVFLFSIFLILNATNSESLSASPIPWNYLVASAILSLFFNFFINFGIAYTYPLFISLGTVVGIPLNAFADEIFRDISFGAVKIEGSLFIIIGFLMLLLPDRISNAINTGFSAMLCLDRSKCRRRQRTFTVTPTGTTNLVTNADNLSEHNIFS